MSALTTLLATASRAWADYGQWIVIGSGIVLVLAIAFSLLRLILSKNRSKSTSTLAAVIALGWTSEGMFNVAYNEFGLPLVFVIISFTVFELLMLAGSFRAEEERSRTGVPGAAATYVVTIAILSGAISSFGAHSFGEILLRMIVPISSVALWYVYLVAERDSDTPEMKAARARAAADREATWAITPRTIAVRCGLMKPGKTSTSEAQRRYLIHRMVVTGHKAHRGGWGSRRHRSRLERMARSADDEMISEVRVGVSRAVNAVELILGSPRLTSHTSPLTSPEVGRLTSPLDSHLTSRGEESDLEVRGEVNTRGEEVSGGDEVRPRGGVRSDLEVPETPLTDEVSTGEIHLGDEVIHTSPLDRGEGSSAPRWSTLLHEHEELLTLEARTFEDQVGRPITGHKVRRLLEEVTGERVSSNTGQKIADWMKDKLEVEGRQAAPPINGHALERR